MREHPDAAAVDAVRPEMNLKKPSLACLTLLLAAPALAAPPAHAPAHGYRNNPKHYRGYTGAEWPSDYGVTQGRCNTEEILTVVGAAAGAVIGNRTASSGDRAVATVAGAIIGGVIGNRVGDAIDDRDRACMGQSLELLPVGKSATWTSSNRVTYQLQPVRDLKDGCRVFEIREQSREGKPGTLTACRGSGGVWTMRPN